MNLSDLFEKYKKRRLWDAKPGTLDNYAVQLRHLDRYLKRPATTDDLDVDTIVAWRQWLLLPKEEGGQGQARYTAKKAGIHICALWNFAARERIVEKFPDLPPLKCPHKNPVAWDHADLAKLWEALAGMKGAMPDGSPRRIWWLALHACLWDTGERIGPMVSWIERGKREPGITWGCVDLLGRRMVIPANLRKGSVSDEVYVLHASTVDLLRALRHMRQKAPTDPVFFYGHVSGIWSQLRRIRREAKLPDDRYHSFHCLRRTVASLAEAAGMDAQKVLRHSDAKSKRRYIDQRIAPTAPDTANNLPRPQAG